MQIRSGEGLLVVPLGQFSAHHVQNSVDLCALAVDGQL